MQHTVYEKEMENMVAGIDPARHSMQIALVSPSKEYFNKTFPVSPSTAEIMTSLIAKSTPVVVEGFATTGRLFFLELLNNGYSIGELNPNLGKHARILENEGHSDKSDARAIARAGIYFSSRLSIVSLKQNEESLAVLVKTRQRMKKELVADMNRTHSLLSETFGTFYQNLKNKIHSCRGRTFLKSFPSLNSLLENMGTPEVLETLDQEIINRLRLEKAWISKTLLAALEWEITFYLEKIEFYQNKLKDIEKQIAGLLETIDNGSLLQTVPGIGTVSAATIIAETRGLHRFRKESKFAAYCGLAPKLWQSGQMKTKNMKRKNYNRILKGTFYNIAFTAARVNKQAKEYYQKKINEGKHHRQALLCLARQYCRITYVMMKKNEAFHAINA